MTDGTDKFRDDSPPPFHVALDMPLPDEVQIGQLYDRAMAAHDHNDTAAVMDAVGRMKRLSRRNRDTNSGPVAPIQGQG
jgi:hypothetical protein